MSVNHKPILHKLINVYQFAIAFFEQDTTVGAGKVSEIIETSKVVAHRDGIFSTTFPASIPTSFIFGTWEHGLAKPDIVMVSVLK